MLKTKNKDAKADPTSLLSALSVADGENYLGSTQVIDDLLRNFAVEALQRRDDPSMADRNTEIDIAECERLAGVMLGMDKDYTPVPRWNAPGWIDKFVAEQLNIPSTDPQKRIQVLFMRFLTDIYKIAKYSNEASEESWGWQLTACVETYRDLLLGLEQPKD